MYKNVFITFIIFGAFIGFLFAGAFLYERGNGIGWQYAVYGAGFGGLLGYLIAFVMVEYKKQGFVLMKKFKKINPVRGKHIEEIITAIGNYSSRQEVVITDGNNEKGWYYNFTDGVYSVQLLVGADDICIGVAKETINDKPIEK